MNKRIDEIREQILEELSQDDMRKLRTSDIAQYRLDIKYLLREIDRLQQWINDLQSGMYVNCVYCGHQYGPSETTPVSMADALKAHIEQCPEHPMSHLKTQLAELQRREQAAIAEIIHECDTCSYAMKSYDDSPCNTCLEGLRAKVKDNWQWRGPQEEGEQ